jgi:deoxyribonuclease-4
MRVGAHVSVAGGVDNAVGREEDVGGNCGQIFTASPQVWAGPDIEEEEAAAFRDSDLGPWVIHASYLVNLATPKDDLRKKSIESLQAECDAAARLGIEYVNVHLGAHTGAGVETGLDNAASAIDELDIPSEVTLLAESDAGSGTKLGDEFEHLAAVRERSRTDIGFCLDTAHAFAAGYDLSTASGIESVIAEFDDVAGMDSLRYIHLNDSKHSCGTNKDEHAHIGEGEIGEAGMDALINHDSLHEVPFVLETPTEDGRGFAWNIKRVRELRDD